MWEEQWVRGTQATALRGLLLGAGAEHKWRGHAALAAVTRASGRESRKGCGVLGGGFGLGGHPFWGDAV